MPDREKVIKGLEHCSSSFGCYECPYSEIDQRTIECQLELDRDALALLKEQDELIKQYKSACELCKSRLKGVKPF